MAETKPRKEDTGTTAHGRSFIDSALRTLEANAGGVTALATAMRGISALGSRNGQEHAAHA